jgi:hypothetical protein
MFENWKADIPSLSKGTAIFILVLNIVAPPFGTLLLSCLGGEFKPTQVVIAILQLLTLGIIIGWIWSIWWGILTVEKANERLLPVE